MKREFRFTNESGRIQVEGYVVSRLMRPSHWTSVKNLDEWLREERIPDIEGVDTRALVKRIREKGVMLGAIAVGDCEPEELM